MKDEEDARGYSFKEDHLPFFICNFRFVIEEKMARFDFFNDKSKITNEKWQMIFFKTIASCR
jgi:hypothetical protein